MEMLPGKLRKGTRYRRIIGCLQVFARHSFCMIQMEARREHAPEAENLLAEAREHITYLADHTGSVELTASYLKLPQIQNILKTA
jgi:hypothetical protein